MVMGTLDFSQLLGFDILAGQVDAKVDFADPMVGAKLGAKVGLEPKEPESK